MTLLPSLVVVSACLIASIAEARGLSPAQTCQVAKMRATGAEIAERLRCEVRTSATGATPACLAAAAARRDEAYERAEERGGCATSGDAQTMGLQAAYAVESFLGTLRPYGPAASRCTQRLLALSGRAAVGLTRIFGDSERNPDHPRLVDRLQRARADFEAAYRRAESFGDCQYPYPGDQFYSSLEYRLGSVRDVVCPTCGVRCPCWTTAHLDEQFPPGAFDAMGGTVCGLEDLGPVVGSADFCTDPRFGGSLRSGFGVLVEYDACMTVFDLGSGACQGVPDLRDVTPIEAQVCAGVVRATRIHRAECNVPS